MRAGGRSDGQTGRQTGRHDEGNSRFCNFAKAPKNEGCANIKKMDTGQEMLKHETANQQQACHTANNQYVTNCNQKKIYIKFLTI